jgi:hypothetical protein
LISLPAILSAAILMIGCGKDKSNPISAFQPEIVNTAGAFQFQVTGATNVTTTLSYNWDNAQSQVTVDHSTAMTAGAATVTIFDADSTQVYASGLLASGTDQSSSGTPGTWIIRVVFSDFDGTVNFRVEPL